MTYSNFHNIPGLLLRMLRDKNATARFVLIREVFKQLLTPVDIILRAREKKFLRDYPRSSLPIILIVGPPRSGTTLIYETLTKCLPVTYFNNLSALFPRSPISACHYLNVYFNNSRQSFRSYYGNIAGFAAPDDGLQIWNRWLGEDRYNAPQKFGEIKKRDMKTFFNAWLTIFGKPLVNKSNRNAGCISMIADVLDNAFFILVRRNPLYIAQSLIIARKRIQGSKYVGWGLRSKNSDPNTKPYGYINDICDQVSGVEMKMQEDIRVVERKRIFEISYEDFCRNPIKIVQEVSIKLLNEEIDKKLLQDKLQALKPKNYRKIGINEFEKIKLRLIEIYGNTLYSS